MDGRASSAILLFAMVARKPKFQQEKEITEQETMECRWACSFLQNVASFRMQVDLLEGLGNQKQMNTSCQQMFLEFCNG